MLTEHCDSCAKNLRFHTCNGNVKVCPGFIDRRAGCRRCVNVRSCKKLGKEIGIYHLCVNFEYDTDQNHLIPLEKFPDYEEYLERHSKPKVVEEPKKKRGRPKGSIKKIKKSVTDEAQELISQYEKELAGIEELDAADKAALKNANYESQPVNWSPETLANTIIDNNYDPRLFELVNEKDILKPTNPVQFIIDPRFLNISLFPMQLKIALDYFAAFCTDCSDTEFIRKVKVNTPIEEIIDRTVLYVNGICPKCGKSRYEHILEKSHHNYNTLVGIAGQRCVTGDTQVITENGIISMQSIADLHTCVEGFIKYNGPKLVIEDGTLIEPSFFYRSKPEETFRVTLKNGISICGTQEHPIFTSNGFKKIKELKINDIVPLYDGKSVHTSYINIDNYFDASDCIEWTETSIIQSIQKDKIQETFDFYIPNYHRFIGNNILNHNSGKSIFHGILAAAVLGQYLALPNPVTYMKSVAQATFTMTFVGLRFQDAYDNLWRDFYANVTESPWFKMYNNFLIEEGIRLGKPLIKQADTFITYIGKRISVNPSGPDKRKLRGRCITGNMLINTNKGLFRASSNSLKKYLVYDRGYYYNIGVEKQKEQKHCVSCYFSNGLLLEASEDHKIPCYDLTTYLTEAKDLQNKYVMCQLGGGFGESVSEDPYHMNKKDTLQYIAANMNSFEFTSYSRKLQLAILKFCFCKIIKNKIVLSKYDANILAQELGRNPISFEKQDCRDYLIPGTNVYTKSELNKLYNVYVPEYLNQYIDKGIVFVRCVKVSDLGLREVYDIEVFSNDHVYSANGIIVHNTRILGSMDEVSHFFGKDASMTLDADEVSIALENSLKTVRNSSVQLLPEHPDIPQAHAIYISSPRSKLDKGMRLLKQSACIDSMYGFHKCIDGDSLIQTNLGIIPIKNLNNIKFKTNGEKGQNFCTDWVYAGKQSVYKVVTYTGNEIICTKDHYLLSFKDGGYEMCKLKDLSVGDTLVLSKKPLVRTKKLELNLIDYKSNKLFYKPNKPKYMTPELAFIMGSVMAEGNIYYVDEQIGWNYSIDFHNTNIKYVNKFVKYTKSVFGKDCGISIKTKKRHNKKDIKSVVIRSRVIVEWFRQLGWTRKISYEKELPWCILQADNKSQMAFIAGFIEGDGSITNTVISFTSASSKLLKQIQVLLNSHGIISHFHDFRDKNGSAYYLRTISRTDTKNLYNNIKRYLVSKKNPKLEKLEKFDLENKVDISFYKNLLVSRRVPDSHTTDCYNDKNERIKLIGSTNQKQQSINLENYFNNITREELKKGKYDFFLENVKLVSSAAYKKLIDTLGKEYWNTKIKSITYIGKRCVYDLTINKKDPSYTANGLIVHNSTWDFNPNFTKESFKDEYARDPIAAETNFGANPPFGDKQFISNPALLLDIISKRKNVFEIIKYNTTKDSLGASLRYPIIRVRPHGLPSILSVDAGYNNNSFALCLMHLIRKESEEEEGVKDVVACSGVIEIQPDEGLALSFPKIYDMVISRIIKEFNVKMLAVDRWQSIDIRQRVYEEFGIESIQYSVVYDDFLNLRDDITSGNFMLPRCEQEFKEIILMDKELKVLVKNKPISHLIIQMLTSKDTGRTVTKGEETSDDILRAMCLGHAMLIDEDYAEIFADDYQEESNSVSSFGASVMYSNMGNSGNTNLSGIGCKISI